MAVKKQYKHRAYRQKVKQGYGGENAGYELPNPPAASGEAKEAKSYTEQGEMSAEKSNDAVSRDKK